MYASFPSTNNHLLLLLFYLNYAALLTAYMLCYFTIHEKPETKMQWLLLDTLPGYRSFYNIRV